MDEVREWNVVVKDGRTLALRGTKDEMKASGYEVLRTKLTEKTAIRKAIRLQGCVDQREQLAEERAAEAKKDAAKAIQTQEGK